MRNFTMRNFTMRNFTMRNFAAGSGKRWKNNNDDAVMLHRNCYFSISPRKRMRVSTRLVSKGKSASCIHE